MGEVNNRGSEIPVPPTAPPPSGSRAENVQTAPESKQLSQIILSSRPNAHTASAAALSPRIEKISTEMLQNAKSLIGLELNEIKTADGKTIKLDDLNEIDRALIEKIESYTRKMVHIDQLKGDKPVDIRTSSLKNQGVSHEVIGDHFLNNRAVSFELRAGKAFIKTFGSPPPNLPTTLKIINEHGHEQEYEVVCEKMTEEEQKEFIATFTAYKALIVKLSNAPQETEKPIIEDAPKKSSNTRAQVSRAETSGSGGISNSQSVKALSTMLKIFSLYSQILRKQQETAAKRREEEKEKIARDVKHKNLRSDILKYEIQQQQIQEETIQGIDLKTSQKSEEIKRTQEKTG